MNCKKVQIIKKADPSLFENDNDYVNEGIAIKKNRMMHELLQIAAIALRAMSELDTNEIKWV